MEAVKKLREGGEKMNESGWRESVAAESEIEFVTNVINT